MSGYGGEDTGIGGSDAFGDAPDIGTLGGTVDEADGTRAAFGQPPGALQSFSNEEVNADPFNYDFEAAGFNAPGSFSLGSLVGYQPQQGLPTTGGAFAGNADTYGFSDLFNSPFGQIARGLLNATPIGGLFNAGMNLYTNRDDPAKAMLGLVPGWGGFAGRAVYGALQSPDPLGFLGQQASRTLVGALGSQIGGALGGQLGATAGSTLAGMGYNALQGRPASSNQLASQDLALPSEVTGDRWAQTLQRNFGAPG